MRHEPTVHVVDDDDAVRKAMCMLFRSDGLRTADYAAPDDFLAAVSPEMTGCIVLDIRMPAARAVVAPGLVLQRIKRTPTRP